jgi:formylglycine-generating enzyme required for sulfatase activity
MLEVSGSCLEDSLLSRERDTKLFQRVPSGLYVQGVGLAEQEAFRAAGFTLYTGVGLKRNFVRSFWIRTHPVSVREFREYERATGRAQATRFRTFGLDAPMTAVSHLEAAEFVAWKGGRLPTVQEWEAAARGAEGRLLPWGSEVCGEVLGLERPLRPGSRPDLASPFGVQDLIGCVAEWTSDFWEDRVIVKGVPFNARIAHLADEAAYRPEQQLFNVGFRYVLSE